MDPVDDSLRIPFAEAAGISPGDVVELREQLPPRSGVPAWLKRGTVLLGVIGLAFAARRLFGS